MVYATIYRTSLAGFQNKSHVLNSWQMFSRMFGPPLNLMIHRPPMLLVLLALTVANSLLRAQSLAAGISAMEGGRLEEAERILSEIVRQQPDSADANLYLGLTRFRAGRSAAARAPLERAVGLSPSSARAWKALGVVTMSNGNLEGALPALGRACELAENDEEACYFLARNLQALGRYESARAPFEKALRAAPEASSCLTSVTSPSCAAFSKAWL